jgi:hypothetical protein
MHKKILILLFSITLMARIEPVDTLPYSVRINAAQVPLDYSCDDLSGYVGPAIALMAMGYFCIKTAYHFNYVLTAPYVDTHINASMPAKARRAKKCNNKNYAFSRVH